LIYHELGHWVVARELGFEVGKIEVQHSYPRFKGSSEVFLNPTICDIFSVAIYIKHRVSVLLAGVASQTVFNDESSISDENIKNNLSEYDKTDQIKINELLTILVSIEHGSVEPKNKEFFENKIRRECWEKVIQIIKKEKGMIEYLSVKICNKLKNPNGYYTIPLNELESWVYEYE